MRLLFQEKKYAFFLLLSGVIGLVASFILTLDKIKLLENPQFAPACSLNPIITCSAAMSSAQATTLGIPNSMMGIVIYTVLIVISGSIIIGVYYSRRIMGIMTYIAIAGFVFTNYLILQSVLVLHVICPWCFTIWISVPIILLSAFKLYEQRCQKKDMTQLDRTTSLITKHALLIIGIWYLCLFFLLAFVFREYWVTIL